MPTGYTAILDTEDGSEVTFPAFVWRCAREFDVRMRELPMDVAMRRFEPDPRLQEYLDRARLRLRDRQTLDLKAAEILAAAAFETAMCQHVESMKRMHVLRAKYEMMLAQVQAWEASDSLVALKAFMINQLDASIKFDCIVLTAPVRRSAEVWLAQEIEFCTRNVEWAERDLARELERCEIRNTWFDALCASVGAPPESE
jgi:hypothetical protein